ncbi:hypothetical protein BDV11DRAFT_200246 [Aspergillus similis]
MLLPTLVIHGLVMLLLYFRRVHEVYTSHGHPLRTECSQSRVRMQTWCVRLSCGGVALITAVITDLPLIILTLSYPLRSHQGKWQAA